MGTVIDELVTILGIDIDPTAKAKMDSFNALLGKATKFSLALGAALTTAAAGTAELAAQSAQTGHELSKFSKLTGIGTDQVQEWEWAMISAGGTASNMRGDMEGMLESISSPIPGEFNHALFMMGINAKDASGDIRDIGDVLLDVSDKMKKYSPQQQMVWGKQLGLSHDTIKLLQKGREGIKGYLDAAKESGAVMSPEQIKLGHQYVILLNQTQRVLKVIKRELAASLLPIMAKRLKLIKEWIRLNRDWIKLKIADVTKGITKGFKNFWEIIEKVMVIFRKFLPGVGDLTDKLLSVENILAAVQVALIAMGAAAAATAMSWLPLIAGAAAFFLIVEDIVAYTEGRESYTGDFVKGFQSFIDDFNERFPKLTGVFQAFLELMKDAGSIILELSKEGLGQLLTDSQTFVEVLSPLVSDLLTLLEKATPDWLAEAIGGAGKGEGRETTKGLIADNLKYSLPVIGPLMMARDAVGAMNTAAPDYTGAGGKAPANVTNHIKNEINVSGTGQPQEVADRVLGGVGNTVAIASGGVD